MVWFAIVGLVRPRQAIVLKPAVIDAYLRESRAVEPLYLHLRLALPPLTLLTQKLDSWFSSRLGGQPPLII
jgi:hypothetical protein